MTAERVKISVAKGDGIGPEIMDAVLSIFDAAQVPLDLDFVDMGKSIFDKGHATGMTPEAKASIEANGILFKGPMETPKGKGVKSINVTARKTWSTYANRRHFRSLHGVDTVFSKAGIPVDITIVRENIEDTYGGIEHHMTEDVAVGRRIITRPGCEQVVRFAFEMARKEGFKTVHCGHKANIMKLTDGMFLNTFYEIAKEYPEIEAKDVIVDDLAMKLVVMPQMFEVVVLPNLQGDIISDLCAGLVGGLGFAPSANIGDKVAIFEAVHGTAPDIAGKNIANPTSLLISGVMMLRHLGFGDKADQIENALLYTLEQGVHTGDFGDKSVPASNTTEFAETIIGNMGKKPSVATRESIVDGKVFTKPAAPTAQRMMVSSNGGTTKIDGIDLFVEWNKSAEELYNLVSANIPSDLSIGVITNRGTAVYPDASLFTECVNQYTVRLEGENQDAKGLLNLAANLNDHFRVNSTELLLNVDGKGLYSLGQGQAKMAK